MTINAKDIDLKKIKRTIDEYVYINGFYPKYIIMNYETLLKIKNQYTENYENYVYKIFDIKIAIDIELSFGDIVII